MEDWGHVDLGLSWGPAEQAAIDRCLTVPGLSERKTRTVQAARLTRTIETEIIPRLMLAHRGSPDGPSEAEPSFSPTDVAHFTRMVLARDAQAALRQIEAIRSRGRSLETVFLDLLGPTARLLGDMWRDDLCSFADVTIGLSRLQQVLRELAPLFEDEGAGSAPCGRILLAGVPGEQHSFGVSMLESFFRRAGWEVFACPAASQAELTEIARDEWLDAVGLSMSCDVLFDQVRPTIQRLRAASLNPALVVLLGGRFFIDHPDRAVELGADSAASDPADALRRAATCKSFALARC